MNNTLRIGVLGEFNPAFHSHPATNEALLRAADQLALPLEIGWVPTMWLLGGGAEKHLPQSMACGFPRAALTRAWRAPWPA